MSIKINRFLVTGANGFVGQQLCAEIIKRGWKVKAALRKSGLFHNEIESVIVGQIDDKTNWTEALRDVDIVICLVARVHVMHENATDPLTEFRRINTAGTEHLARCAAAAGVKRLVYASSIKVNGEETLSQKEKGRMYFSESDTPHPQSPYAISKWEAEQAIFNLTLKTNLEAVILRPPLVYGPHVKGNFAHLLRAVSQGLPLPLAAVHNLRSLLYVENLVDALITCATHPAASGQTYLVSDGEDISTPDLLRRLATAMGVAPRLFACPSALLQWAARLTGKSEQLARLLSSLQVDSGKIRRDLNWRPPYTLQQGLQATADWYRHTPL